MKAQQQQYAPRQTAPHRAVPASYSRHSREFFETTLCLDASLSLSCGTSLAGAKVGVRMLGPAGAPVVSALGGISASRRVLRGPGETQPGWWQGVLGQEGVHATQRYRVLGLDWLGGSGCASFRADFPPISTLDQARVLAHVLDALHIRRLRAVIGASYGGMIAQHFAAEYPRRLQSLLVIASAHEPEPMAVARRLIQKQILDLAGDQPEAGVALARALAMTTYRSAEEFRERFAGPRGAGQLASYLQHQGQRFAQRFDRPAYRRLMDSVDGHTLDPARLQVPLSVLGFSTDELCPPDLLQRFARSAPQLERLDIIDSPYGHDAFLCEPAAVSRVIEQFLAGVTA